MCHRQFFCCTGKEVSIAVCFVLAMGCQSSPLESEKEGGPVEEEESTPETEEEWVAYDRTVDAFSVGVSGAEKGGKKARLLSSRGADSVDERPTVFNMGEESYVVETGEEEGVGVAAHSEVLQRLEIDAKTVLVHIAPEETLRLEDDSCFGWRLTGPGLDIHAVEAPKAACVAEDQSCPRRLVPAPWSPVADDPLCDEELRESDGVKRCIRPAHIDIESAVAAEFIDVGESRGRGFEDRARVVVTPGDCGFPTVKTPAETVLLAPGVDANWKVTIDEQGRVGGRLATGD